MFGIGVPELLIILVIGLIIFGPGKLPEIGRGLGKTIREFRKVSSGIMDEEPVEKTVEKPAKITAQASGEDKSQKSTEAVEITAEVKEVKEEK